MDGALQIFIANRVSRRALRNRPIYRKHEDAFSLREDKFIKNFRLPKNIVLDICNELRGDLESEIWRGNIISHETKVLCALRFFATGSYQQCIANEFILQISQPSASRAVSAVCDAIINRLYRRWVVFPSSTSEILDNKVEFMRIHNFPGVIGAIDGTHIEIVAPPKDHPDYPEHIFVNRHFTHSINVQVVCNADMKILSCNARYPGQAHDSYVWRNSALINKVKILNRNDANCWLIGDSGYPLEPWLMVPFINTMPHSQEERYNKAHKKTRNVVERCIGVLKSRFRCIHEERVLRYSPPIAAKITYACVVLHNICKFYDIPDPDDDTIHHNTSPYTGQNTGVSVRERLVRNYF